MQLSNQDIRILYESVIRPTAASSPPHPDPIGYVARALLLSDGDPDYIDVEGNVGFMPVNPDDAVAETGAGEVQSLQGNVITTMAMDIQFFARLGSIDAMIIAFHEGEDNALLETPSKDMKELLSALPQARLDAQAMLFPRRATLKDVMKFMGDAMKGSDITDKQLTFFKKLVKTNG